MSYQAPPPPPPGTPPYGAPGQPAPTNQKAVWSLVLGILGLVCCGFITGIPALILGRSAQAEITATGQGGAGMAKAGVILGIIAIVWGLISLILVSTGVMKLNFSAG